NPSIDQIAGLVQQISDLSNKLNFHSTITIHTPQANGAVMVEQQFLAVDFQPDSSAPTKVPIPAASMSAAHMVMSGQIVPESDAPAVADAQLTLGAGTFTLPLGAMLLNAAGTVIFGPLVGQQTADLKTVLTTLINCNQFATDVINGL